MTQDEIIALALSAGALTQRVITGWELGDGFTREVAYTITDAQLLHIAQLVAEREREACVLLAEAQQWNTAELMSNPPQSAAARQIWIAIRARGALNRQGAAGTPPLKRAPSA